MSFPELAKALAQRLGLDEVRPDERGTFTFAFEEGLAFSCRADGRNHVLLCGTAAPRPGDRERSGELCERLLRENLARARSWPEVLCMNPETGDIELFVREPADLSPDEFAEAAERFVNHLEHWARACGDEPPAPGPFGMLFP